MTGDLLTQIQDLVPLLNSAAEKCRQGANQGVALCANLGIPSEFVQPHVDTFNAKIGEYNTHIQTLAREFDPTIMQCRLLPTLQAGADEWRSVAKGAARPFAVSLSREELEGSSSFSWVSTAALSYWQYMERNKSTAGELAKFCQTLGDSLQALSDAVEKQNAELSMAILSIIIEVLALMTGFTSAGAAAGALLGLPAGGVGAIPGWVIGAWVGAVLGVIASIFALIVAIHDYNEKTKTIANEAAAQLTKMQAASDATTMEAWPAPYAFIGGGSSFREGK
jgi:hypothetical protein